MKILLNYANCSYRKQQRLNSLTGKYIGKFDKIIETSPDDIDIHFRERHRDIFNIKRGDGLWLWKPFIINKVMNEMTNDDILCYMDSGAFFIRNISNLVSFMESENIDILLFDNPLLEKQFTKRSVYDMFSPEKDENQFWGGYIVLKKSELTMKLMNEWLQLCCNKALLYDDGSDNNDPIFEAHREDQALLSLLAHKYKLKAYRDPSQYGWKPWEYAMKEGRYYRPMEHKESTYPQIIVSTRSANPWKIIIYDIAKYILYKMGILTAKSFLKRNELFFEEYKDLKIVKRIKDVV